MRFFIGGREHTINAPINSGGEGEIYVIESSHAAKIYHRNELSNERQQKVLALCNSYTNNVAHLGTQYFAFPEQPAYSEKQIKLETVCGFAMQFFPDCPSFGDINYDPSTRQFKCWNSIQFDDENAIQQIYNVFDLLEKLHRSRIVLGDINPGNLLFSSKSNYPIIIDLDASQIGQFPCHANSDEYLDPFVQQQGKNMQDIYTYSTDSDIFAMACVCYEFFVGSNPFFLWAKPPKGVLYNKQMRIPLLRYIHENTENICGVELLSAKNDATRKRLEALRKKSPELYDFFFSTFVLDKRINLMQTLDRSNPRHPAYIFYTQSGFDEVLKEILNARGKLQALPSQPATVPTEQLGIIPDSGFAKTLQHATTSNSLPQSSHSQLNTGMPSRSSTIPDSGFTKIVQPTSKNESKIHKILSNIFQRNNTGQANETKEQNKHGTGSAMEPTSANSAPEVPTDSIRLSLFLKNYEIDLNGIWEEV